MLIGGSSIRVGESTAIVGIGSRVEIAFGGALAGDVASCAVAFSATFGSSGAGFAASAGGGAVEAAACSAGLVAGGCAGSVLAATCCGDAGAGGTACGIGAVAAGGV